MVLNQVLKKMIMFLQKSITYLNSIIILYYLCPVKRYIKQVVNSMGNLCLASGTQVSHNILINVIMKLKSIFNTRYLSIGNKRINYITTCCTTNKRYYNIILKLCICNINFNNLFDRININFTQ